MIVLQDMEIDATTYPEPVVVALQKWITSIDPIDQEKEHTLVISLTIRLKVKCVDVVSKVYPFVKTPKSTNLRETALLSDSAP